MNISPENTPAEPEIQEKTEIQSVEGIKSSQTGEQKQEEKPEDPNWRAFREARKQDRIAREQAEKKAAEREAEIAALKAAMEAAFAKDNPQPRYNEYGYPAEETEEDRVKKLVQAEIERREAESERIRHQREQQEYPQRLQKNFPDFQQTISSENLDYLDYHYPEVARPLQRLADGYDKWHDIYKAVKKFVPNNQDAKRDAARADANFAKPKSISSQTLTPPMERQSWQDVEKRREMRWREMQKSMKGLS